MGGLDSNCSPFKIDYRPQVCIYSSSFNWECGYLNWNNVRVTSWADIEDCYGQNSGLFINTDLFRLIETNCGPFIASRNERLDYSDIKESLERQMHEAQNL